MSASTPPPGLTPPVSPPASTAASTAVRGAGPVIATRSQVARDHAELARRDPDMLVTTALRTKSAHAREILAELAWPGHSPADLMAWAASGSPLPRLSTEMDPLWLGHYGRVLAVQTGLPEERAAARRVLEAVLAGAQGDALPAPAIELLLQLRVADRDRLGAQTLLEHPAVRAPMALAVAADLANPALFRDESDELAWASAVDAALGSEGMAPIGLLAQLPGERLAPFDRLVAPGTSPVAAPHLVTVMVSAWRPGRPLLTALRSLLQQTWGNLEILVIDDASGPDYTDVLRAAESMDPRIRVIRKAINGGTYRARNTGVRQARGEFLTVLDSDDWMHPQAIETAVRRLLTSPGTLGVRSQGARITDDLELNRPGYLPRVTSAASLMVRVHPVIDRVGFFDTTSKGADTEFTRRIEAAFGHVVATIPRVFTLIRAGDTLSSTEFSRGWRHGSRHAYKCAYGPWHRRIRAGSETAFLDPGEPRRFPEPRRWAKPVAPDLGRSPIDICLAGDWRRWGGPQRSMMEEIAAARLAGLRVGIMHLEAFRFMTSKDLPLCEAVLDLVNRGEVEWIQHDDDIDIDVLMIRYPPILQYPPVPSARSVRAKHVLIVANQAPLEPDGSDQRYVVTDVTQRTRELFRTEPLWVPQGPTVRRVLQEQDPAVRMAPWDNPGLIDVSAWTVRQHSAPGADGAAVVVGRYSRDNIIKFAPTLEQIRAGYEFGPGYQVRMMGARNTLAKLAAAHELTLADLPDNWVLLPHKAIDVVEFLGGLDFFLYLDNPDMHEAFGRTLLEAAASGVLTIAHPKHEATFGDTIDYALPGEAQALIAHYVAHPDQYAERVARSTALVRERFGHRGLMSRLGALGAFDGRPEGPAQTGPRLDGTDWPVPRVRVAAGQSGAARLEIAVEGPWRARVERIRAAGDGGRADELGVVHAVGAEAEVAEWLGTLMAAHPDDDLPQALLRTAPASVGAVVTHRDSLVHVARRVPTDGAREGTVATADPDLGEAGAGDQRLLAMSGITVPPGWVSTAWWGRDGAPRGALEPEHTAEHGCASAGH